MSEHFINEASPVRDSGEQEYSPEVLAARALRASRDIAAEEEAAVKERSWSSRLFVAGGLLFLPTIAKSLGLDMDSFALVEQAEGITEFLAYLSTIGAGILEFQVMSREEKIKEWKIAELRRKFRFLTRVTTESNYND